MPSRSAEQALAEWRTVLSLGGAAVLKEVKKGHLQAILTGRDWGRGVDTKISGRAEELLQRVKTLLGIGSCS